jgi:hypothetical protein
MWQEVVVAYFEKHPGTCLGRKCEDEPNLRQGITIPRGDSNPGSPSTRER